MNNQQIRVSELLKHAPAYHHWVDKLLAGYELSAKSVAAYGFQRLPQFFNPQTLAAAKCVEVDVLPKVPWHEFGLSVPAGMDADFTGITFRNTYFVIRREVSQETLHFHEMVHVGQWQILGNDLFPLIYALEAFRGSYSTNFLEDMARNITTQFENTNSPFPSEAFIAAYVGHYLPTVFTHYIKGEL